MLLDICVLHPSALKFLFHSRNHECHNDIVEAVANECFLMNKSSRYIIEDTMQIVSNSNGKMNDVRFVALIERIYDVVSTTKDIVLDHPFSIAMHVLTEEQKETHVSNGKYMEAAEAQKHQDAIFDFEVSRRHLKQSQKQSQDLVNLEKAHQDQYEEFIQEWHEFQEAFKDRAEKAISSIHERHAIALQQHEKKLFIEASNKPRLFSKELKESRKKEKLLVQEENYSEAQRIKELSDVIEEEERLNTGLGNDSSVMIKATNFRKQQDAEITAMTKRIETQIGANKNKKEDDCKRLLQRNQNIQMALRSKYVTEGQNQFTSIEKDVRSDLDNCKEEKIPKNCV